MQQLIRFIWLVIICSYIQSSMAQISPKFEMRGVWIATVMNIDWPQNKHQTTEEQKQDFIRILNMHQANGMNAVFVQIRPVADAFYASSLEPWSEFLNGEQGKAPSPYYDPLIFMIDEAHKLGMEFHAWLNPYRAVFDVHNSSVASNHITKTHPEWFLTYGTTKYFNPGLPQVRDYVAGLVKNIVTNYAVDGIHMDDYFYPYRIAGKEFPDEKTYQTFGGGLQKDVWRRSNCDSIVLLLYKTIRATNSRVKFGISPFGVWRNASVDSTGSNTKAGQTCYDDLYADILLWLKKGWVDYVVPQLYWERGHKLCDYDTLLEWWNNNTYDKHLYIGHGMYRAGSNTAWRKKDEIPKEITALREYTTTQGSLFFSSKDFEKNPNGWCDSLKMNYYALPAIIPPMYWIDSIAPEKPKVVNKTNGIYKISYQGAEKIKAFAIYVLPNNVAENFDFATLIKIIPSSTEIDYDRTNSIASKNDRLFVASVDLNNNISYWVELK